MASLTQRQAPMVGRVEEERRKQIVEAASLCLAEEGVERLTLRRVARRANVSIGMITYYFGSKDELLVATLLESSRRVREAIQETAGEAVDTMAGLRIAFQFALKNADPLYWPLWFTYAARAGQEPELHAHHVQRVAGLRDFTLVAIENEMAAGRLNPKLDPRFVANLFVTLYQGLGMEVTLDENEVSCDQALEMLDFLFAALRP
jgi:TetR/AcrR family transcriptional repressor of bet genes